jgi:hypothetical protein
MFQELKDYLKITWDNEDSYLQSIITKGEEYLKDLTGTGLDFEKEGQAKSLLFDYCRYYYNNAIEYFEGNFQQEILRLQLKEAAKDFKKEVVADEG